MATVWNIRGTNGSGKTTVARAFLPPDLEAGRVELSSYASPTKKDPERQQRYQGYLHDRVLVLGVYDDGCGGMDRHPAGKGFEVPLAAIRHALQNPDVDHVICEGVLASGVYGSWHEFGLEIEKDGHQLAFAYLQTPAEICLQRIQQRRQEAGKEPKADADWDRMVENVTGKHRGTAATRLKAIADEHLVYDLPLVGAAQAMRNLVAGDIITREACCAGA